MLGTYTCGLYLVGAQTCTVELPLDGLICNPIRSGSKLPDHGRNFAEKFGKKADYG